MNIRPGSLPSEGQVRLSLPSSAVRIAPVPAASGLSSNATGISAVADAPAVQAAAPANPLAAVFSPLMTGLQQWCQGLFGGGQAATQNVASGAVSASGSANPDYSGTFSLTVKTREGDTVTIHFGQSRNNGTPDMQSTEASYEVEGNLSADERKALDRLVGKMTDLANTFFSGTTGFGHLAILDKLDFFDAGQLAGFALDLSQRRDHMGNQRNESAHSSLSFAYDVDLAAHTQHLKSEAVDGYSQAGGAGGHRYGYDLTTATDARARAALNGIDVSGLGRPRLYQSAPTALPAYYQGALQALASSIDSLSSLAEQTDAQTALAQPEQDVGALFRGLAQAHPAYRSAAPAVQKSLDDALALLPQLLRNAAGLRRSFAGSGIRVTA